MTAIEDVTQGLAAMVAALEETATAAAGALAAAEQGVDAVAVAGPETMVEVWTALKNQLEGVVTQIAGTAESVEEVQTQANAIADGT
jgi:hypothetical protein